jgi:hypothetical protein
VPRRSAILIHGFPRHNHGFTAKRSSIPRERPVSGDARE